MTTRVLLAGASAVALAAGLTAAFALDYRGGRSAYGDWQGDTPGLMRKISPEDVAAPLETPTAANRSKVVPKPADASLKAMPGFSVAPFATDLAGARVIRVAPNGDIFVSQSRPDGKITVLRPTKDGSKVEESETFATAMKDASRDSEASRS